MTNHHGSTYLVSPWDVNLTEKPSDRDVAVQRARLEDEGQIEPLLVNYDTKNLDSDWPYASAQVVAIRELEWPTMLICFDER